MQACCDLPDQNSQTSSLCIRDCALSFIFITQTINTPFFRSYTALDQVCRDFPNHMLALAYVDWFSFPFLCHFTFLLTLAPAEINVLAPISHNWLTPTSFLLWFFLRWPSVLIIVQWVTVRPPEDKRMETSQRHKADSEAETYCCVVNASPCVTAQGDPLSLFVCRRILLTAPQRGLTTHTHTRSQVVWLYYPTEVAFK